MEIPGFKSKLDGKIMLQIYKKFYSSSARSLGFLTQLVLQFSVALVTAQFKHVFLKKKKKKRQSLNLAWARHLDFTAFTSKPIQMNIFIFIFGEQTSLLSWLRKAIVALLNVWYENCAHIPYFGNFLKE